MKISKKQKKLLHNAAIVSVYVMVFGLIVFFQVRRLKTPYVLLVSEAIITPKDTAPLPIPEDVIKSGKTIRVPILMYHHVGTPPEGSDRLRYNLTVPTEQFEKQVQWLKENGYTSISMDELYNDIATKTKLPEKPVIFTFDDGYDDVFINAVPILKKYGYVGVFGIITQFPGITQGTNTYATWAIIADAKTQGMEIICHTQNHFDGANKKFNTNYIYQNLSGCQQDIRDHLGSAEPYLIYPYGHYNASYIEQAKKAGFVISLTVHEGTIINISNLMEIPRLRINPSLDLETFKRLVK
jgi:peptidoglycan/xylan/chitin deacetylase (PgdA/CDA1 family)